jgi:hypothetical protein
MIKQNKKKEYCELAFLYFRYRNLFDYDYQKYGFFKNLIAFICRISDYNLVRRIFEDLVKRNCFDEKRTEEGVKYLFNPYNRKYEQKISDTIIWD